MHSFISFSLVSFVHLYFVCIFFVLVSIRSHCSTFHLLTWIIQLDFLFVDAHTLSATWMIICLQRYRVNWQNRQIYRNCKLHDKSIFCHAYIIQTSAAHLHIRLLLCFPLFPFCTICAQVSFGKSNKYHTQRWSSKKSNYVGAAWQSIRRY